MGTAKVKVSPTGEVSVVQETVIQPSIRLYGNAMAAADELVGFAGHGGEAWYSNVEVYSTAYDAVLEIGTDCWLAYNIDTWDSWYKPFYDPGYTAGEVIGIKILRQGTYLIDTHYTFNICSQYVERSPVGDVTFIHGVRLNESYATPTGWFSNYDDYYRVSIKRIKSDMWDDTLPKSIIDYGPPQPEVVTSYAIKLNQQHVLSVSDTGGDENYAQQVYPILLALPTLDDDSSLYDYTYTHQGEMSIVRLTDETYGACAS